MRNVILAAALLGSTALAQTIPIQDFSGLLDGLRAKYGLPALMGVAVTGSGMFGAGVSGNVTPGGAAVTASSVFQLGSTSKTMTATMIARLVEKGLLSWDSKVVDVLPDVKMRDEYRDVTLRTLLAHRAGTPHLPPPAMAGDRWAARKAFIEQGYAQPRLPAGYSYSNVGYVTATMMAEKVTGKDWQTLMREELFGPLGMTGCTFGPGEAGDPLPHRFTATGVQVFPMDSGNSAVVEGSDRVRCPVMGMAPFLIAHLTGEAGGSAFLKAETWKRLHTDSFSPDRPVYAQGWSINPAVPWAKGPLLWHTGSNTFNYAYMWVVPGRNAAVLVATNVGNDEKNTADRATAALTDAINTLIREVFKANP